MCALGPTNIWWRKPRQARRLPSQCTGWRGWGWTPPSRTSPPFVSPPFLPPPQDAFDVRCVWQLRRCEWGCHLKGSWLSWLWFMHIAHGPHTPFCFYYWDHRKHPLVVGVKIIQPSNEWQNFLLFQVSEEAPSFATDSKFGDLLVVVVPQQVGLSSQQCQKKTWKWSDFEDQLMARETSIMELSY